MNKYTVYILSDFKEIIPRYLSDLSCRFNEIKCALEDNDFNKIKNISHKLAGNAGGFGLDKIGALMKKVELESIPRNSEEIKKLVEEAEQCLLVIEVVYE